MSPDDSSPPSPDAVVASLRDLVSPTYAERGRPFAGAEPFDPAHLHLRAGALVARLKALNRTANAATRARKHDTAAARQDMDHALLGLQNLLYEKRHLEREIEKCRQFASIYQEVPLHSVEEFQRLAPPEAHTDQAHQLMLNRLSFELAERQRLDLKRKELIVQKEELLKQSKTKQATLDSVKVQIDALVKTAGEIQKKVGELVSAAPMATAAST